MGPTNLPKFQDVSWRWICYATSTILIIAIVFSFFYEMELKQDVTGEIVSPSDLKIQGLTGLISAIYVEPSAQVVPGTPLFSLDKDLSLTSDGRQRPTFDEQMRQEKIRTLKTQYSQRREGLDAQWAASLQTQKIRRSELAALDEQTAQQHQLVGGAEQKLARLASVADYVPADRVEQARAEVGQGKVALAQNAARRQQLLGELTTLRSGQSDLEAQREALATQQARDLQDLHVDFEQNRRNVTISAPSAGRVTFSNLVPGRSLQPEDVALVIGTGERGALRAALRVPSRRRGFVQEGQTVRLKFDAFPYERFGSYEARIVSISGTTIQSGEAPLAPTGATGPADILKNPEGGDYMAWAALKGDSFEVERQHFKILPGMRATASIVVERRTIAEWVLAPLFRMLRG